MDTINSFLPGSALPSVSASSKNRIRYFPSTSSPSSIYAGSEKLPVLFVENNQILNLFVFLD